jgi:hypothetical protein
VDLEGRAWILYAFDVGRAIDLAACRALITTREVAGPRRPEWPHLFGLNERPLLLDLPPERVEFGGQETELQLRLILYDFGSVSVAASFPVAGPAGTARLAALSRTPELDGLARAKLDAFVARAGSAIRGPQPTFGPTRFVVLQADDVPAADPRTWLAGRAGEVARFLRDEPDPLSDEEIRQALARSLADGTRDLVVIDSSRALVIDDHWEDTLAVLDFANCERLTLEELDEELDEVVEAARKLHRGPPSPLRSLLNPGGRDLRRLTRFTVDVTSEYEAVENAVKLTGDDYLARIYRMVIDRFHLRLFQEGIERKLQSLWNIQQVFLEQASARRCEVLEWVIIALIAIEIIHAFI